MESKSDLAIRIFSTSNHFSLVTIQITRLDRLRGNLVAASLVFCYVSLSDLKTLRLRLMRFGGGGGGEGGNLQDLHPDLACFGDFSIALADCILHYFLLFPAFSNVFLLCPLVQKGNAVFFLGGGGVLILSFVYFFSVFVL